MLLVEYWADYDDEDQPIPFRRRVFSSSLDGKHITGKNVEELIKSKSFSKLDDDDAVSLCCIGILQLVLLSAEDGRAVPNWILRRYPRVVAWSSNKKIYRNMLRDFLHGGPSSFQTPTNNSFFNMGMPLQPGSSNWQSQMPAYTPTPNWQPPIPSHPGDAGLCDPIILKLFTIPLL
nr:hypothetical protein [Tanacetum cinerariifolium]